MRPTLKELEDILRKPDDYFETYVKPDGSIGAKHKSRLQAIVDWIKYTWWRVWRVIG